jgi:hypothetical protein
MVYANADLTKAEQAREVIAFADYWQNIAGQDPGLLVFDSKLTTYKVLSELSERAIRWLTLRERGPKLMAGLAQLPEEAWKTVRIERRGRYRAPQIHDELIQIKGIDGPVRQLAVRNIGREQPTLLITNDLTATTKQPLAPLPRRHRHHPHQPRHAHRRAQHPHLPPRPHRRRPRRAANPHPLARRPPTTLPLPTPLKPQPNYLTENRG